MIKDFFTFLFYVITILPLCWELTNLSNLKKRFDLHNLLRSYTKDSQMSKELKSVSALMVGYIVWIFVGLFSSINWAVFLIMIFMSFIPKKTIWFLAIDSFITSVLLLFVILNQYHLKIDVFELIKNLF
jgi:hypothetical protein